MWALIGVAAVPVAAVALGLVFWTTIDGQEAVRQGLLRARPWLLLWRIAVLAAVVIRWNALVTWLASHFELSSGIEGALRAWRWRAALWLAVMDLVLAEDLPGLLGRIT